MPRHMECLIVVTNCKMRIFVCFIYCDESSMSMNSWKLALYDSASQSCISDIHTAQLYIITANQSRMNHVFEQSEK